MDYIEKYLNETKQIASTIDTRVLKSMVNALKTLQESGGRLFFLGVGGSAANCIHAVNDFRKIAGIETYSPAENIAELTARTNDDGWETVFANWLKISRLNKKDVIFVLSVGGGNKEKNISVNLVRAVEYAKTCGSTILGIVGRDGGFTAQMADHCIIIPTLSGDTITPHAEAWQGVVWHMLVSHPEVLKMANKWESMDKR